MQYNTQQKRMPLPEYGRSIQNMVDHALTIEDRLSASVVQIPLSTSWEICFPTFAHTRFR